MTTKRFKSVCTETGREFWSDRQGLDENNPPWLERKTRNLYNWAVQAWIPIKHTKIELCQSTGLTDAKGQEVYEGDVLKWDGLNYCCEWNLESAAFIFNVIQNQPGIELCNLSIDADQVNGSTVIGNRWMPQAELQAMAEAVSDRY